MVHSPFFEKRVAIVWSIEELATGSLDQIGGRRAVCRESSALSDFREDAPVKRVSTRLVGVR